MTPIPTHFLPDWRPIAAPTAVVTAENARFTVLTPRLLRLEYSPNGRFEDRPSQPFWYREQPVPDFSVSRANGRLTLQTEQLTLTYTPTAAGFTPETLGVAVRGAPLRDGAAWRFGDVDPHNLGGTARTLDEVSGATRLEPGLLSRSGWTVVDDSATLVFNAQGWPEPRQAAPGTLDLYFFGYGRDYTAGLQDFVQVAGPVPLPPRWALGNWWSRYWAYTQTELLALMDAFRRHAVPLSVCIVDMDWHLTDVGPYDDLIGHGSGWTGYTWNRALFPDPDRFIAALHEMGLRTALNLHPADGVRPHEAMYPAMAARMGVDPASQQPVLFDIADPAFAQAYFELLHHPEEARGVDFWWIDWQQGTRSSLPGLDPLWLLNHLHFYDLGRDGEQRPFIFSRWGGLGNHRYPIGFSGDTHVTWESLAFQPYFTATAANVNYGWWSHDIGGHMLGVEEPELYARWVQFGLFSPILRLHSSKNPFHERRPWAYDAAVFQVVRDAMQLRHALIPYLYTLAWRNHADAVPPLRPMYHLYPDAEAAYHCPQQYAIGAELIAAPFTSPADPHTNLSRQVVWLPPGDWIDFFTGEAFTGDGWHAIYGGLERIPLLARAGAILPLGPKVGWGGVDNPAELDVHLFAGADGRFLLYEDDGATTAYREGAYGLTEFTQSWQADALTIELRVVRPHAALPPQRAYRLHVHGVQPPDRVLIQVGDAQETIPFTYDAATATLHVGEITLTPKATLRLVVRAAGDLRARRDRTADACLALLRAFRLNTLAKAALADLLADPQAVTPADLARFKLALTESQMRALLEITQQAGLHHVRDMGTANLLVLWNNRAQAGMRYRFTEQDEGEWDLAQRYRGQMGQVPRFAALTPEGDGWEATADYFGLVAFQVGG
jgi:alpha-glucosidase (family GH31 glycosyl hydrolase)